MLCSIAIRTASSTDRRTTAGVVEVAGGGAVCAKAVAASPSPRTSSSDVRRIAAGDGSAAVTRGSFSLARAGFRASSRDASSNSE